MASWLVLNPMIPRCIVETRIIIRLHTIYSNPLVLLHRGLGSLFFSKLKHGVSMCIVLVHIRKRRQLNDQQLRAARNRKGLRATYGAEYLPDYRASNHPRHSEGGHIHRWNVYVLRVAISISTNYRRGPHASLYSGWFNVYPITTSDNIDGCQSHEISAQG